MFSNFDSRQIATVHSTATFVREMTEEYIRPNPFSRITALVADPRVLEQAFWAFNPSRPLIADTRLKNAMVLADFCALESAVRAIAGAKYLPDDAEQAVGDVLNDIALLDETHCQLGKKEREVVLASFYASYLITTSSTTANIQIPDPQEISISGVPRNMSIRSDIRNRAARVALFVNNKLREVARPSRLMRRVTGAWPDKGVIHWSLRSRGFRWNTFQDALRVLALLFCIIY